MKKTEKIYSTEKLVEYIKSEVDQIEKEREDKKNWKLNEEFHSQVQVRIREE